MDGKQVLLTGGTGGLGLGVTPAVVRRGAKVTIPYQSEASVERLKKVLSPSEFESIRFVTLDLSKESAISQLIEDMGRVDVLIHLVGGFSMGQLVDYSYEDWKKDFQLNLDTTFLVCKHSLRAMINSGYGRIVTVGSKGAIQPMGGLASYCASKAGVVALTSAIAEEVKDYDNITANCVLPSIIDTPTNREAMGSDQADQWVRPESLAEAICYLASESAREVRGATLPVYGKL